MRRRAVSIGFLVVATSLAAACDKSNSIVVVKVSAEAAVTGVYQLRAWVSNGGEGVMRSFPLTPAAQPIAFDTAFSLSLPRDRTGALDIALEGLDADGLVVVANGSATLDLRLGDNITVTITLQAGPSLCGNGVIDSGEACDDNDRYSNGDCDYLCQPRTGGPGVGGSGGMGGAAGTGMAGTGGTGGTGGRPCTIELLTSGDFDGSNTRWMQVSNSRALIYDQSAVPDVAPRTPPRLAWLGFDAANMEPVLRQSIAIPADAVQVNISGYYRIETDESPCTCDYAWVELNAGGTVTQLTEWTNENANTDWAFFSTFVNGTPIQGQNIFFQLHARMDDAVNTSFYFDSLSVTANVCP
jgi:hypothetical protein